MEIVLPALSLAAVERKSFAIAIACGTYGMDGFALVRAFLLKQVENNPRRQYLFFVAFLLSIPFFKLSHACFKFTYFVGHLHFSRLGRRSALLCGKDLSLEFDDRIPKFDLVTDMHQALQSLAGRFQRRGYGVNPSTHN